MKKIIRLQFEDHGQDVLTWYVDLTGRVIATHPHQGSTWTKCTVQNVDELMCENQNKVIYTAPFLLPGEQAEVAYPVIDVDFQEVSLSEGAQKIIIEREEQIEKHNYTNGFDIEENREGQLITAARSLIILNMDIYDEHQRFRLKPAGWDSDRWLKMTSKPYPERLIIAGALIAAEYDRVSLNPEYS